MGLRLIGDFFFFFQNFQSLEIIGDMYRDTEAFCDYSRNSPEATKNKIKVHIFGNKNQKNLEDENIARKNKQIVGKKLPNKNDPYAFCHDL